MGNRIKYAAIGWALAAAGSAQAAGFALIEQSASGMGNAYAGAAAIAEDASTIFFNPAGMTYIEGSQAVGALHLIKPTADFNNNGSIAAAGQPLGDEGPDAGDLAFVPNLFLMTTLTPSIKVGVGISAPFGLKTEYDDDAWMGRFHADQSELKTININPSIAFKLNERVSLGFGVSAMRAEATLSRAVNFGPFGAGAVKIEGDDWGYGYNMGATFQATADTRIGVAYRSEVKHKLEGDVKFSQPAGLPAPFAAALAAAAPDGDVTAKVDLPASFSVSAFSQLNNKWDLMGDITWTEWSNFEELRVVRKNGQTLALTPENWENTMRYSLGVNYHYSHVVKLRAGLAYDEEAIKSEYRTARIPGNDRKWLSLGASYQVTPVSRLDVGYSHLFISDAKIDDNQLAQGNGRLTGDFEGSVDILSAQYTHHF